MSHQSGIKSNQTLRDFFAKSKEGNIRMLKVVINTNEELILDASFEVNAPNWDADYNQCILTNIDPKQPCFFFYRLDEKINTGYTWLFISWSPDFAPVKQKMLYASTKSTLKQEFGAGQIKDELFGTVNEDISLEGYLRHKTSQAAPAPLTMREEEIEEIRKTENLTKINVDTKQKTLQGVMFPVEQQGLEKLELFKRGAVNYVRLAIDIKEERILLDKFVEQLDVNAIAGEIPTDQGRFHLYRYQHTFEGETFNSVLFIYSMPGFVCTVKERMLYSSCKSEMLSFLKGQAGLDIAKTFETSEPGEITVAYIMEELHPKKLSDGLKFSKPKGPSSRGPRRVTRPATTDE